MLCYRFLVVNGLFLLFAVGCSQSVPPAQPESATGAKATNVERQQDKETTPLLDGTYSIDGGRTNLTIEHLGGSAYAVTLSDGRIVSCTLENNVLTGVIKAENVTVALEGSTARLIAFGDKAEYGKISNEIRPIPHKQQVAAMEPSSPTIDRSNAAPEIAAAQFPTEPQDADAESQEEGSAAELVNLEEVNTTGNDWYPWITPDGLTIFWQAPKSAEDGGWIWSATRRDADSPFENKQIVCQGRHVSATPDGLQIITTGPRPGGAKGSCLYMGTRKAANVPIQEFRPITELLREESPKGPSLSEDGLTLYFVRSLPNGSGVELAQTTRSTISSKWSTAKAVPMSQKRPGQKGYYTWPAVWNNGLSLLTAVQPANVVGGPTNFVEWRRESVSQAFSSPNKIDVDVSGQAVFGRSPRYIKQTNELFFCKPSPNGDWDLWVVKNFKTTPAQEAEASK